MMLTHDPLQAFKVFPRVMLSSWSLLKGIVHLQRFWLYKSKKVYFCFSDCQPICSEFIFLQIISLVYAYTIISWSCSYFNAICNEMVPVSSSGCLQKCWIVLSPEQRYFWISLSPSLHLVANHFADLKTVACLPLT